MSCVTCVTAGDSNEKLLTRKTKRSWTLKRLLLLSLTVSSQVLQRFLLVCRGCSIWTCMDDLYAVPPIYHTAMYLVTSMGTLGSIRPASLRSNTASTGLLLPPLSCSSRCLCCCCWWWSLALPRMLPSWEAVSLLASLSLPSSTPFSSSSLSSSATRPCCPWINPPRTHTALPSSPVLLFASGSPSSNPPTFPPWAFFPSSSAL